MLPVWQQPETYVAIDRSAQSTDLNLTDKVHVRKPSNLWELERFVLEEWTGISQDTAGWYPAKGYPADFKHLGANHFDLVLLFFEKLFYFCMQSKNNVSLQNKTRTIGKAPGNLFLKFIADLIILSSSVLFSLIFINITIIWNLLFDSFIFKLDQKTDHHSLLLLASA